MRKGYGVTLYCRAQKVRKRDGKAPVEVTITTNGQKAMFQLDEAYDPAEFARMRDSKKVNEVKTLCSKVSYDITQLHTNHPELDAPALKERYLRGDPEERLLRDRVSVQSLCKAYLETVVKGLPSYRKYEKAFERFMEHFRYRRVDEITPGDIKKYILGLREQFVDGTVRNEYKKVKSLFNYAFQKGVIKQNPFFGLRFTFRDNDPVFLDAVELGKIRDCPLEQEYLKRARTTFLFACGCGLEYSDIKNLKPEDVKEVGGLLVIEKERVKTKVPYMTVLVGDAPRIWRETGGKVPCSANQPLNRYLKIIAEKAGIQKRVTLLTARHSFSTMLLSGQLGKMVPIEVLRRCLGHTSVRQSEHYCRLIDKTLIESFKGIRGTE